MSTFRVEVVTIDTVSTHPNAERLELATVKGWQCCVQKGYWQAGDKCVYIPVDSVLPPAVEGVLFGPASKVKLSKSRVKTIKLRGAISQGMVADLADFDHLGVTEAEAVGTDLAERLQITKYEQPEEKGSTPPSGKPRAKQNPLFRKYTDLENFKNYPGVFQEGEEVFITEKIHGTNFRCGWLPYAPSTLWKRVLKFLNLAPQYEFVFGSRNVQLQDKGNEWTGFYESNVYAKIVEQYDLRKILQPNEVAYGEIYGDSIQKNYRYGCDEGQQELVLFDLMVNGEYLNPEQFFNWADRNDLPTVPLLYSGPYNEATAKMLATGDSILHTEQHTKEGIVIKPAMDAVTYMGRKVLKLINDDYLLRDDTTDFH